MSLGQGGKCLHKQVSPTTRNEQRGWRTAQVPAGMVRGWWWGNSSDSEATQKVKVRHGGVHLVEVRGGEKNLLGKANGRSGREHL